MNFLKSVLDEKQTEIIQFANNIKDDLFKQIFMLGYEEAQLKTIGGPENEKEKIIINDMYGLPIEVHKSLSNFVQNLVFLELGLTNATVDELPVGYVRLEFETVESFQKFLEIVFNNQRKTSLYKNAFVDNEWKIIYEIGDTGEHGDDNNIEIFPIVTVMFPKKHSLHVFKKVCERIFKLKII